MHGLESEYYNRITFVYLDIDDPANDVFKGVLNYRYQPHLYLIDGDGHVLSQWVGPVPREDLVVAFEDALSQ